MRLPIERKPVEFYLTLHKNNVRDLQNRIVLKELGPVMGTDEESDESSGESDEDDLEIKYTFIYKQKSSNKKKKQNKTLSLCIALGNIG